MNDIKIHQDRHGGKSNRNDNGISITDPSNNRNIARGRHT